MNDFLQPLRVHLDGLVRRPARYLLPPLPLLLSIVAFFAFSNATNRYLDEHFTYHVLWLTFVAGLAGLALALPWLVRRIAQVSRQFPPWLFMVPLLLAAVATYFVAAHVEPRHRIQSDESALLSNARSMEYLGKTGSCDEGYYDESGLECINLVQNFKTKSVPFLQSLIQSPEFPQGLSSAPVFRTTLALLAPTALLLFMALLAYSGSAWLATLTTALVLSHPTVLFQFHSASVEPWYLFFAAGAGLIFALLQNDTTAGEGSRHRSYPWAPLLAIAALVAFAAQTRQESLASMGFILAPLLLHATLSTAQKTFFFAALALFVLPVLWVIYSFRGFDFQAGEHQAHGIGNLIEHLGVAWSVMTRAPENGELVMPFIRSHLWLAALGLAYTLYRVVRNEALSAKVLWLFLLALPQTLVIFENVSGDMTIEINQRYSLVFIPLIALMGAQGLRLFADLLTFGRYPRIPARAEAVVLAVIAGLLWLQTASYQSSFENNIMYRRNQLTTEEQLLREWYSTHDNGSPRLFIYSRPWHFVAYGHSAIHYSTWTDMDPARRQQLAERFKGSIYYVRGLDCWDQETWHGKAVEQRISWVCDQFERRNSLHPVYRAPVTGGYEVQVQRLEPGEAVLRIDDLRSEVQAGQMMLAGLMSGCRTEAPLTWIWRGVAQDWQCRNGEFRLRLDSQPGLYPLVLTGPDGRELWTRLLLHTADTVVPLTAFQPVSAAVGWKTLQVDRSNGGNPLTVAGVTYRQGLGAHAPSRIAYDLPGDFARLQFGYGLDDEETGGDGVVYKVYGDGELLWQSPRVVHGQLGYADLPLAGVGRLELVTESGATNFFDHSNWLLPMLLRE